MRIVKTINPASKYGHNSLYFNSRHYLITLVDVTYLTFNLLVALTAPVRWVGALLILTYFFAYALPTMQIISLVPVHRPLHYPYYCYQYEAEVCFDQ